MLLMSSDGMMEIHCYGTHEAGYSLAHRLQNNVKYTDSTINTYNAQVPLTLILQLKFGLITAAPNASAN